MTANSITLAGLVVTRLNSVTFSQAFTAALKAYPVFVRDELTALDVAVTVGPETWTKLDRSGLCEVLLNIPVVVRQPTTAPATDLSNFLSLVQEIKDDLIANKLGAFTPTGITQGEPYSIDAVEAEGTLQSIITVQYKGFQ